MHCHTELIPSVVKWYIKYKGRDCFSKKKKKLQWKDALWRKTDWVIMKPLIWDLVCCSSVWWQTSKIPLSCFCLLCGMLMASIFDLKLDKHLSFYSLIYMRLLKPLWGELDGRVLCFTPRRCCALQFAAHTQNLSFRSLLGLQIILANGILIIGFALKLPFLHIRW